MREIEISSQFPPEKKEVVQILRIGVDIDGTILNIETWVIRLIRRGLRIDTNRLKIAYFLDRLPEITAIPNGPHFVQKVFENWFIYGNAKPIPGAIETLNHWRNLGYEICFPTARPKNLLQSTTFRWFSKHNLSWAIEKIIFADSFSTDRSSFKQEVCRRLGLQVLIDDHAETLRSVNGTTLKKKIGLRYQWNRNEDIGDASLVDNWEQIAEIVAKIARYNS